MYGFDSSQVRSISLSNWDNSWFTDGFKAKIFWVMHNIYLDVHIRILDIRLCNKKWRIVVKRSSRIFGLG